MKIVHVMDWFMPGFGYQENFLPHEQWKLGNDVTIITTNRMPKQISEELGNSTRYGLGVSWDGGVKIIRLPSFSYHDRPVLRGLSRKLKEIRPDVVQAHGLYCTSSMIATIHSKRIGYDLFVDDHTNKDNFYPRDIASRFYVRFCKNFYKQCDGRIRKYFPVSNASKIFIEDLKITSKDKICMQPLGVNTTIFNQSEGQRKIGREKLGLEKDDFAILTAGKFNEKKDIPDLINAFKSIKNPKVKLILVGAGKESFMDYLKTLSKEDPNIFFHGFVKNDELPILYNAADLGVWPGDNSITALEAGSTGLPLILPKDEAYRLLLDGGCALGFDRGNVVSLTKAIESCILNKSLCSDLRKNALKLFNSTLSWEKIAQQSLIAYGGGTYLTGFSQRANGDN